MCSCASYGFLSICFSVYLVLRFWSLISIGHILAVCLDFKCSRFFVEDLWPDEKKCLVEDYNLASLLNLVRFCVSFLVFFFTQLAFLACFESHTTY